MYKTIRNVSKFVDIFLHELFKGSLNAIFDSRFFSLISFPKPQSIPLGLFPKFSQRYLKINVITAVNNSGEK
jgi:hypothetical protein